MGSSSSDQLLNAEQEAYPGGNSLLHQFVLDNSYPNDSGSESYINEKLLSMDDISVNVLNNDGYSALHLAVLKANLSMVKKLLSCLKNIDVNTKCASNTGNENTALHLAVKCNYSSIVQELLNKEADVNIKNSDGKTALCLATEVSHLDEIKVLLCMQANLNQINGMWVVPNSPYLGYLEAGQFLIGYGAAVNVINEHNISLIHDAQAVERIKIVEFLIGKDADLHARDNDDKTPLHYAVLWSNLKIAELLIRNGAAVNAKDSCNETPLYFAVSARNLDIVELLIRNGAGVNVKDRHNKTPLHFAVTWSSLEILETLVRKGADVNITDANNETPLHFAVSTSSLEKAALLVRNGADLNAKGKWDGTPLHYAVRLKGFEIVELLVSNGADVNAKDKCNETPLHYAVQNTKVILGSGNLASAAIDGIDWKEIYNSLVRFLSALCSRR